MLPVGHRRANGYERTNRRTSFGNSVSVIAGEGTAMERDYDGHGAVYWSDLEPAEKIGRTAGERAVRRLNRANWHRKPCQ